MSSLNLLSSRNIFVVGVITCLLSACATQVPPKRAAVPQAAKSLQERRFEQRQQQLSKIKHWSFKGRAGIQRQAEGWSATFHWRQHGDDYRLRIIAPLGRGTFEILREAERVNLIDPQNRTYSASSPEHLLEEAVGWRLPISHIEYWVRGLLAPGEKPTQLNLDENGLAKDFAVGSWRVSVLDYQLVDGLAMPRKLFMNYDDTKIRLIINSWNLSSDDTQ